MNLDEIKQAVESGKNVYWRNKAYKVIKDSIGQWLVVCEHNNSAVQLTWRDGITINGVPGDFFL